MPTFTISQPPLLAGQYYLVRYRLLPNGAWTWLPAQSNAPFTISGLGTGTYELEVSVAEGSPATVCDPISIYFTVSPDDPADDCLCVSDVVASITTDDLGNKYIHLEFTVPSTEPPCGWLVSYVNLTDGSQVDIAYPTLSSPLDLMLTPKYARCYHVYIYKNCCGDIGDVLCWDAEVCETPPPCTPATLVSAELVQMGGMYLKFVVTQPTPPVSPMIISYNQVNALTSGLPDTGTFNYTGGGTTIYIPVNPNMNLTGITVSYAGTITDGCGGLLYFDESIAT